MRKLRLVVQITLSFALVFTLAFGGVEIWFRYFHRPIDNKAFRLSEPSPYRHTSYFSRAFIDESFSQPAGWSTPPGTNLILPNDFNGKYFHVLSGLRITVGQPTHFNQRILIFGGSTIYCSEVPDNFTIPSLIQQKLMQRGYRDIAVFNYGTTTVTSSQQLERLRGITLHRGDVVIFYDGVNDVYHGVYNARPHSTIVSDNRQRLSVIKFLVLLSQYSEFSKYILNKMESNFVPTYLLKRKSLQETVNKAVEIYVENEIQAYNYSHEHGAEFLHFLQPNLFTLKKWTSYEKKLVELGAPIVPNGMGLAFSAAYLNMREAPFKFPHVDLSSALDDMESPAYLDFCHVTDRANAVIAENIVNYVIKFGLIERR